MNPLPLRFAWILIAMSVLECAWLVWFRFQTVTEVTLQLADFAGWGLRALLVLCVLNLGFAATVQIRARRLHVRSLALSLIAGLLPFFAMAFCDAARIGRL